MSLFPQEKHHAQCSDEPWKEVKQEVGVGRLDRATQKRGQCCNLHPQQKAPEREVCSVSLNHVCLWSRSRGRLPEAASWRGEVYVGPAAPRALGPKPPFLSPSCTGTPGCGRQSTTWRHAPLTTFSAGLLVVLPSHHFQRAFLTDLKVLSTDCLWKQKKRTYFWKLCLGTAPPAYTSVMGLNGVPPEKTCWSPNPQNFRV